MSHFLHNALLAKGALSTGRDNRKFALLFANSCEASLFMLPSLAQRWCNREIYKNKKHVVTTTSGNLQR